MVDRLLTLVNECGRSTLYCALVPPNRVVVSCNRSLAPVAMTLPLVDLERLVEEGTVLADLRRLRATRYPPDPNVNYQQFETLELLTPKAITPPLVLTPSPMEIGLRTLTAGAEPTEVEPPRKLRLFYSYSHKDRPLRDHLEAHLAVLRRNGGIEEWHDRRIEPGWDWKGTIDANLEAADLILLLVSANFLASDYCYDIEMTSAMARHERGEARVIPVILKDCDWEKSPFGKLQALPSNGNPITLWPDRDQAFAEVAKSLRTLCEGLSRVRR